MKDWCQVCCVKVALWLTMPACRLALFHQMGSCLHCRTAEGESDDQGKHLGLIALIRKTERTLSFPLRFEYRLSSLTEAVWPSSGSQSIKHIQQSNPAPSAQMSSSLACGLKIHIHTYLHETQLDFLHLRFFFVSFRLTPQLLHFRQTGNMWLHV